MRNGSLQHQGQGVAQPIPRQELRRWRTRLCSACSDAMDASRAAVATVKTARPGLTTQVIIGLLGARSLWRIAPWRERSMLLCRVECPLGIPLARHGGSAAPGEWGAVLELGAAQSLHNHRMARCRVAARTRAASDGKLPLGWRWLPVPCVAPSRTAGHHPRSPRVAEGRPGCDALRGL